MRRKHFLDEKRPELGQCDVGDIIEGCIDPSKMKVIAVRRHNGLQCDVYKCKFIEGPCEGDTMDIYPFYAYRKVTSCLE